MELPIALAVGLRIRRGELLGLRWTDIDLENQTIQINNNLVGTLSKSPKSENSNRSIQLPESLIPILKKHRKLQIENRLKLGSGYVDEVFVCCNEDGSHYNPGYFSKKFKRFLANNDLPHIHFHDLRHSHATMLLKYWVHLRLPPRDLVILLF
jgi:integrase